MTAVNAEIAALDKLVPACDAGRHEEASRLAKREGLSYGG